MCLIFEVKDLRHCIKHPKTESGMGIDEESNSVAQADQPKE